MGWAIIGGLLVSTIVALSVTPVLYAYSSEVPTITQEEQMVNTETV